MTYINNYEKTTYPMNITILYEDSNFLIVNKPAGLVVHATLDSNRENLYNLLRESGKYDYLGLHHRLDKDTSGAILFTKNSEVNTFVQNAFETHSLTKKYWTIVHGEWLLSNPIETIEDFLKKEKNKNKIEVMVKVNKGGQKAVSLIQNVKYNQLMSLMEFTLKTGRMHQIRIQSALRSHPIVGDAIYGNKLLDQNIKPQRLYLHSKEISFEFNGKTIKALAPLDEIFLDLINKIT